MDPKANEVWIDTDGLLSLIVKESITESGDGDLTGLRWQNGCFHVVAFVGGSGSLRTNITIAEFLQMYVR